MQLAPRTTRSSLSFAKGGVGSGVGNGEVGLHEINVVADFGEGSPFAGFREEAAILAAIQGWNVLDPWN